MLILLCCNVCYGGDDMNDFHPLFANSTLDPSKWMTIKSYDKGAVIEQEGFLCKHLSLIMSGSVSISTLTFSDSEYMIALLQKDDTYGDVLLFSNENSYLGDIVATSKTVIGTINKDNLLLLLKDDIILKNFVRIMANRILNNQKRVKILSQKSIRDKIMFYLLEEKKKTNSNIIMIPSKQELANILNIPRPSLSRELISLKKDNIIDYTLTYIQIITA